jgi:hypothetical protein
MIYAYLLIALVLCGGVEATDSLQYDVNNRLSRNSIVYQDTPACRNKIEKEWNNGNPYADARNLIPMTPSLLKNFVDNEVFGDDTSCAAVCVDTGVEESLVPHPMPFMVYSETSPLRDAEKDKKIEMNTWLNKCKGAEVGFISYLPKDATLYWVNLEGERRNAGTLKWGERYTVWQNTFLGHVYEICDKDSDELIMRYTVVHNAHVVVGHEHHALATNKTIQNIFDFGAVKENVKHAMSSEWSKSSRVTRTFTPLGFDKGKLPRDIWGSISAFNYNNRDNVFAEEWTKGNKGYFVNWWEVTPYMIGIPWSLKRYWQTRLRELVATWIGGDIPLENTDIYGIRRYEEGARLLTHVDRESTHVVSLIVNIDQVGMREPWMVEIYDFAGRLHEVSMEPGDVVYYESAKALHGRMKPLNGVSYSNLFTHYRPVGDPQWSTRPNPENTPKQVLSIDECQKDSDGVLDCDGVKLPFLSPSNEKLSGANDLFAYWEKVSPAKNPRIGEL